MFHVHTLEISFYISNINTFVRTLSFENINTLIRFRRCNYTFDRYLYGKHIFNDWISKSKNNESSLLEDFQNLSYIGIFWKYHFREFIRCS